MQTKQLLYCIGEREAVRRRHDADEPRPWTKDQIFHEWSFTNVRREDDRVTKWIFNNWLLPHATDVDVWFAMAVARFVNWAPTLLEVGYPVPWDPDRVLKVMTGRTARGEKVYGPAYMIHADNRSGRPTPQYQVEDVLGPLWRARERLRPRVDDTLAQYFIRLGGFEAMGSFMRGQIIADVKFVQPLRDAPDWMDFAVSGPWSRRGLNRVLGRPKNAPWASERAWRKDFDQLRSTIADDLERLGLGDLDGQSLQSCLCELDKYERVRLGEGKPKRRYRPTDPPKRPKGPPPRQKGMLF